MRTSAAGSRALIRARCAPVNDNRTVSALEKKADNKNNGNNMMENAGDAVENVGEGVADGIENVGDGIADGVDSMTGNDNKNG